MLERFLDNLIVFFAILCVRNELDKGLNHILVTHERNLHSAVIRFHTCADGPAAIQKSSGGRDEYFPEFCIKYASCISRSDKQLHLFMLKLDHCLAHESQTTIYLVKGDGRVFQQFIHSLAH